MWTHDGYRGTAPTTIKYLLPKSENKYPEGNSTATVNNESKLNIGESG